MGGNKVHRKMLGGAILQKVFDPDPLPRHRIQILYTVGDLAAFVLHFAVEPIVRYKIAGGGAADTQQRVDGLDCLGGDLV